MSERWPGGIVRSTPVTPAGPFQNGAASGVWSLADAAYWTKQGLWPLAGNTLVVEDVFSTYLYAGNGTAQTITNGVDLAGKGGMVWIKSRQANSNSNHCLVDTVRGGTNSLVSNTTAANFNFSGLVTGFTSSGFSLGDAFTLNQNSFLYASWTFREAPNFFDVVTYTGDGVAGRTINHNLGVAPGMMIVKRLNNPENWDVYHRSVGATGELRLNQTAGTSTSSQYWNDTAPTASVFTVGTNSGVNANGGTYVAYLYAHDTSSTGIIQCGTFTSDGSRVVANVTLGWEPQWVMVKRTDSTGDWIIYDTMRGMPVSGYANVLYPNTSGVEALDVILAPNATGFSSPYFTAANATYIYVAIRRGPMRTPTLGTSVFSPNAVNAAGGTVVTTSFPVDGQFFAPRGGGYGPFVFDRLRGEISTTDTISGRTKTLTTSATSAESDSSASQAWNNTGFKIPSGYAFANAIYWNFRRAPGFFDEVCYTGTGAARTVNHNLGVAPELMIVKARTATGGGINPSWAVYSQATGNTKALFLDQTSTGATTINYWNNTTPTSSVFSVFQADATNASATNYVAYLFASAPGVSKVGSYTGNGSSQTINCAFTTGSRFVMIKRTDSTGDWFVWDSARGIVAGNDPYLALNSTAAEVTTNDSVDTDNTGFIVNQVAASNVNVNGATYIFLAIA